MKPEAGATPAQMGKCDACGEPIKTDADYCQIRHFVTQNDTTDPHWRCHTMQLCHHCTQDLTTKIERQQEEQTTSQDPDKNWEGHSWCDPQEHRTAGPHRAWCLNCSTWCYPGPSGSCYCRDRW